MKICFVVTSSGWGGGENVVHQMVSCLIKKNIDVSIILNNEIKEYFEDLDVEIVDLGSFFDSKSLFKMIINPEISVSSSNPKSIPILNLLLMFIYFFRVKKRINNYLKENNIDIVHSHIEYSDILCYILNSTKENVKWICNIHGPWFTLFYSTSKFSSLSNFFIIKFLKKAFKRMDRVVFVSEYLYNESKKVFGDIVEDKGIIILNGINTYNINKENTLDLKAGFNILFPGGPKLKKGGDILIDAIKDLVDEIPDLNLYIALEVPENHLIKQLVKKYSLESHVNFVGFLKPDIYMALLNSVDLLAMPSRMEPFGMVYLEAMALGTPIIASNVGGGVEIIKNGHNGILTSPEPYEVSNAILNIYNDNKLRKRISENNLKDINNFEWKVIIDKYIELYFKLIK